MKFLKSINRGLFVIVPLVIAVAAYLLAVNIKVKHMEDLADSRIEEFLEVDSRLKQIPREYRNNEEEYVAKIASEARPFFEDDSAYDYYIANNISSQYRTGNFCERCNVVNIEKSDYSYNNGILKCEYYIESSLAWSGNASYDNSNYVFGTFSFIYKDGDIMIHYLNYGFSTDYGSIGIIDDFSGIVY